MSVVIKITTAMASRATWKKAILLFAVTYTVYFCMLGLTIPSVETYTNGMKLFDMKPTGYSYSYAETLTRTLREDGRTAYLTRQLPLDFLYPGLMGLTGALWISLLMRKKGTPASSVLICLPLIAAAMDYMENVMIVAMLSASPDLPQWTAATASVFTVLKSILSSVYYVVLLILLILRSVQYLKQKSGARIGQ